MIATPALLLALAASAVAGESTTLNFHAKRGEVVRTDEDIRAKHQWAVDEGIRVGLKHPSLFNEEGKAEIKKQLSNWRKRATQAP